jgi:hypothetical protein
MKRFLLLVGLVGCSGSASSSAQQFTPLGELARPVYLLAVPLLAELPPPQSCQFDTGARLVRLDQGGTTTWDVCADSSGAVLEPYADVIAGFSCALVTRNPDGGFNPG